MIYFSAGKGRCISRMDQSSVTVETDKVCASVRVLAIGEVTITTKGLHGYTSETK